MARKNKGAVNKELWDRANSTPRRKWQAASQKGFDFYLDEQLTKDESDSLRESGMPTFTINRILPIIEIMKYFVTAQNPRWKAVGVTGDDADIAQIHSEISEYCWYLSNGKSLYSQVILDSLTKGIGYFLVDVDQDMDIGKGEVVFKKIEPYDVFVDPMSRDFLFRDASFITIRKNVTRTQLKNLFPEFARKIQKSGTSGIGVNETYSMRDRQESKNIQQEDISIGVGVNDDIDDIMSYYETYQKIKTPFVNVYIKSPPDKVEMREIQKEINVEIQEFSAEMNVQLEERRLQIQQSLQSGEIIPDRAKLEIEKAEKETAEAIERQKQQLQSQAEEIRGKIEQTILPEEDFNALMEQAEFASKVVDSVKFYENRVKLVCSVGDETFLYEYELPITEYPIIPIPYLYTGTPYPMSAVMPLVGKQQEINKAHQIMIHNANLASNLRWLYEEGSVEEEEWENYSASPGALLKYRQGFNPPTPILPAPINNAFYSITQEGKSDAEYISGVPSAMMGFTQEQPETYRGLLANDEFGTRRLKAWMGSIVEPALEHLGLIFQMVSQSHYTIDKIFRLVQPEAGQKEGGEEKESRINIPIYNDYGQAIGKWNDYASGKFDIRIVAGATMPINRWALLEEYFRWFQAGLIDDIAMIGETDIRNKERIVERKSLYAQLQSQIAQMEESLKDSEGTIETLSRQLVQAGIKDKIKTGETEVRKDVLQTEAQQKLLRGLLKGEYDTAKKDLKREIKSAVDSAKQTVGK